MKDSPADYFLLAFMLISTILYCLFVYLGMGLYIVLLEGQGMEDFSNLTVVTSTKPLLWQMLAVASLVLNSLFALLSAGKRGEPNTFTAAGIRHTSWLFICLLLHGIGCLLPFFMWVPVLK